MGDQWHRMLVAMEKQISDAGMTPVVEVSTPEFRDLLILASDEILPDWLSASPVVVATFKTTLLSTQRVMKAKAIKDAHEKKNRAIQVVTRLPAQPLSPPVADRDVTPATITPIKPVETQEQPNVRINPEGRILPAGHIIR